jgi:Flp pilus assembly protein TadB
MDAWMDSVMKVSVVFELACETAIAIINELADDKSRQEIMNKEVDQLRQIARATAKHHWEVKKRHHAYSEGLTLMVVARFDASSISLLSVAFFMLLLFAVLCFIVLQRQHRVDGSTVNLEEFVAKYETMTYNPFSRLLFQCALLY